MFKCTISSSKVFDIKQDKDGYIWCATDEGFCRFDGIAFKNYRWAFENSLDFTNQQALKIYCDENRIYIGTNFGLLMYDVETFIRSTPNIAVLILFLSNTLLLDNPSCIPNFSYHLLIFALNLFKMLFYYFKR